MYLSDLLLPVLWEWKVMLWRGLGCAEIAGKPFVVRDCWLCETRWVLQWSPSVFVVYGQVGSLGAGIAVRGGGRGAVCISWVSVNQAVRETVTAGTVWAGSVPAAGSAPLHTSVGRVIPFAGVHWSWRSFCKARGTGKRLTALAKEHLHSPWGIASVAQRSLFSIHCRESVDPSPASHKCLHL